MSSSSSLPKLEYVSIRVDGAVFIVKYNRPDKANALDESTMKELLAALQWAAANPQSKVIIVSGEGKFFTTGMDLAARTSRAFGDDAPLDWTGLREVNKLLIETDKILIAAVNGPAAGYGVSSLALFDLVYSVPDAYFFTPFIKWGLGCEGCSSLTFPAVLGRQKASSLIFAGDRMSAEELERAGLVTKILPRDRFMDEVLTVAQIIADLPSGSLVDNKRLVMKPLRPQLLEANDAEIEGLQARWASEEPKEAIKAFMLERERKAQKSSHPKL